MAQIETTSLWGDLVKGISARFAEVFDQAKESYSLALDDMIAVAGNNQTAVFKQKTSAQARERTITKAGTGYLQLVSQGDAIPKDSRLQGYITEYVHQMFGAQVEVTKAMIINKDYQEALNEFADLTVSGRETIDRNAFKTFQYAFTAQASIPAQYANAMGMYGDGKPLCSTAHPRKDGGTAQSNASSTGITLTEVNLEAARLALINQLDDRGKPMRVGTGKLVLLVPPALEKTAVIITKGEKRSGTANNDINIYDGIMTVIASNYLSATHGGSDTAWFLLDPRVAKLVFWNRQTSNLEREVDFNTKNVKFSIDIWYSWGWSDWRGIWGSKGDGASYAG